MPIKLSNDEQAAHNHVQDGIRWIGRSWSFVLFTADLIFGNGPTPDAFGVSMTVGDRSRIKDLGPYNWGDNFLIPKLVAYEEPEREASVRAVAGHMYLVHVRDTDSNHYVLFRVERLELEKSVEISWKLIDAPQGP